MHLKNQNQFHNMILSLETNWNLINIILIVLYWPCSFNELLGLEESPEVEHLPGSQSQKAAHREDTEVHHSGMGGL